MAEFAAFAVAEPAVRGGVARDTPLAALSFVGHDVQATMQRLTPSRLELLVGLAIALGVLAVVLALRAVPPPWRLFR